MTGGAVAAGSLVLYLSSNRREYSRMENTINNAPSDGLSLDEKEILELASLSPSGHNTQPWFMKLVEPFHWIIGNDSNRWLPAVDPYQRETILSIGAFIQTLESAATAKGYRSQFNILASTCQDEHVVEVTLNKSQGSYYNINRIKKRRTVRSHYLDEPLKKEDLSFLVGEDAKSFYFIPGDLKESEWLREQTIEANRTQTYRDSAQKELSQWIRFSNREAFSNRDGLTTASMEIGGMAGWVLRNFYDSSDVMTQKFRDQTVDTVRQQVRHAAGWLLITSNDNSLPSLLEAGRKMQRLFLKIRERNIAIHPMTQVLEETVTQKAVNSALGITDPIQFILRVGYLKKYPKPVSLRRPIDWIIR
jgi:hypothetical protein